MRLTYLRKEAGHDRLILIYGGWSISPDYYSHIARDGWDLAVVSDYTDSHFETESGDRENISFGSDTITRSGYRTIYLYAWSFGVIAAENTLDPSLITRAYAIAGTAEGISDSHGIPEKIFRLTRDTLSLKSLSKFHSRIGVDVREENGVDLSALRNQLDFIASYPRNTQRLRWTRAYIPGRDLIFPPDSQRRSWKQRGVEIVELPESSHAPDLQQIIASTIINTGHIAENFERALPTYRSSASAQQKFAEQLADKISEKGEREIKRILEIGYGAGNLTRVLAKLYPTASITLVDLYDTEPLNLFKEERYVAADAEEWIASEEGKYDLICSSSAMQWFVNLPEFFRQCKRLLCSEGILAVSLLSKGTLEELDSVRVSRLQYLTSEELRTLASAYFGEVEVEEQIEKMEFASGREALLHLRQTGVNAGPPVSLSAALRALRSGRLTYVSTRLIARE